MNTNIHEWRILKIKIEIRVHSCSFVAKMERLNTHTEIAITDLPSHVILDRGRIVGLWEYDTATGSIAWMSFVKKDKSLQEAVARTEQYVRERLGDARSFSLDSPKSRVPRIEALRIAD
jgi:hypothetical protein